LQLLNFAIAKAPSRNRVMFLIRRKTRKVHSGWARIIGWILANLASRKRLSQGCAFLME
jgi:hypothetical protein